MARHIVSEALTDDQVSCENNEKDDYSKVVKNRTGDIVVD
jgi:hypothetical protein